ncbi:hypothetical protein [Tepidibacillus fermentans]|uniref:Sporulation protein Cse60 n=1 Tax=Tepidibacillus fermentans TaxID=1281767 RepID=A0A4R3KJN3_9BACI|nr:hypothetical protein [Tepidibacillus fermentans]TCS82922.1 hypothetical protein EDD72_1075 [Tepidibacillus fermentans]
MYQVKILQANQLNLLEELINIWLKEQKDVNVVDMKFHSNVLAPGQTEYVVIMVYQTQQ